MSLIYVGWDPLHGFQLYQSDPSGNYSGWKAMCIGANHSSATSLLKQDYKDDITLEEAQALCLKTMSKTMDSTKLSSEKRKLLLFAPLFTPSVEFATMTLAPGAKGPLAKIYRPIELDELLQKLELGGTKEEQIGVGEGTGGGGSGGNIAVST